MRIAILLAGLLIPSLCRSFAQDLSSAKPYDIAEAYQIYSLLLPHEESYGFGKGTLVIQEDTASHTLETACFDPKSASRFKDALADYSCVQKRTWLLQRRFQIEKAYELVSSDTVNLLFKERGVDGWQDFYKRYPDSGGFIILSAVGFNKAKTLAVVYTGSSCGGLCGSWRFHLLEKTNGKWKEVPGVTCTTVS
jgi:hypothetical protein